LTKLKIMILIIHKFINIFFYVEKRTVIRIQVNLSATLIQALYELGSYKVRKSINYNYFENRESIFEKVLIFD